MGAMRVLQETAGAVGLPVPVTLVVANPTRYKSQNKRKKSTNMNQLSLQLMTPNWHQLCEICHRINHEPKLPSLGLVKKSTAVSIKTCTDRCKFHRNHQS
jgi:hypothetical protein